MQYRMPAALAEFSAGRFYAGKLKTACADDERPRPQLVGGPVAWPHATLPLLFVDTLAADALGGYHEQRRGADTRGTAEAAAAADGASGGGSTSYRNRCEARLVDALVRALIAGGMRAADIGVVTPYAAQVRAISDQLGALAQPENAVGSGGGGGATDAVEVSSVDGFQGREKEAIVLSAVRSNAAAATGFLKDWRRLNVSITRARCALIVVGDSRTLQADPHWRAFIAHARKGGGYVALPAPRAAAADAPAPN
jgi:superfamily I DNA and/or RNA helicase